MATRIRFLHPVGIFTVVAAACLILIFQLKTPSRKLPPVKSLATEQTADAPLFLTSDGELHPELYQPSAWDLARVPTASHFQHPMGSAAELFAKTLSGSLHSGNAQLQALGTAETSVVYAVADALVLRADLFSREPDKVVILLHRLPDGQYLSSYYSNLHRIKVAPGTLIGRGTEIGELTTKEGGDILQFTLFHGVAATNLPENSIASELARKLFEIDDMPPATPLLDEALSRSTPWNLLDLAPEDALRLSEILNEQESEEISPKNR